MTKSFLQSKARDMRANGDSVKQIAEKLNVSCSSVSLWVRTVALSNKAREKILLRSKVAREKASHVLRQKKNERIIYSEGVTKEILHDVILSKAEQFMLAALIYECEGAKSSKSTLEFTNSDPLLVKLFLRLLRTSLSLDESKFRVVMHLHSYHNERKEKDFWSNVTDIQQKQFTKSFKKRESGNEKHGYRGCVQIKYFDVNIKRMLLSAKPLIAQKLGL
jgi:uncharacterized protein YjcR